MKFMHHYIKYNAGLLTDYFSRTQLVSSLPFGVLRYVTLTFCLVPRWGESPGSRRSTSLEDPLILLPSL